MSGAQETLSVGETSYKIQNGSVIGSSYSVSSQSESDESDDDIEFTADWRVLYYCFHMCSCIFYSDLHVTMGTYYGKFENHLYFL